jgi:hypothetical protein
MAAMIQIAIRCHPRAPVPADELGDWLEREVDELRAGAPRGTVRLSQLTQHMPSREAEIGWLIELELPDDEPLLRGGGLAGVLRDVRMLGLTPTVLVRPAGEDGQNAPSTHLSERPIIDP